jgi:transposase
MGGEQRRLESNAQRELRFEGRTAASASVMVAGEDERFTAGDEGDFYFGERRLDEYLRDSGQGWVVRLKALLGELNYEQLSCRYQAKGRRAIHPRVMLGLIVYGMINGQWSLRGLERLTRVDLGAMWLSGRLQPDHSTIGKFIQLHQQVLSEQFFCELVKLLVAKLHLSVGTVAVDGTVMEAVASRYTVLKAEALREGELSEQAAAAMAERRSGRELLGRDAGATRIAPGEPEAVVQPTKQGALRPSYKPSAMMHELGVVVAQDVHPSSETAVAMELVGQHVAAFGVNPGRLLGDASYCTIGLLAEMAEREIDVLFPSGRANGAADWEKRSRQGKFVKSDFSYDPEHDRYRCPGGQELLPKDMGRNPRGGHYTRYRASGCGECRLRMQCTNSSSGRTLKRYEGDELKDVMATVLGQPAARRQWRRRSAIIEPLFGHLRERQRLTRFHRRGLKAVRVEFALHCIAFNLRKAAHRLDALLLLFIRFPDRSWQLTALASITFLPPAL